MSNKSLFLTLVFAASALPAQEWAQFRGKGGTAISLAKTIPTEISAGDINWQINLPGTGHSSPVAWGDRIFLTVGNEKRGGISLLCVDAAKGGIIWQKDFALSPFAKHKYNSYASATPVVSADRVYFGWSEPRKYTFAALTHEGRLVWERDLGPYVSQHGSGASAMIHGDNVILNSMKDEDSFVIAMNAKSGETVWKTSRPNEVAAYGTATVYKPKGGNTQLLFTSQADGIFALNPDDGKQLWQMPGVFSKRSSSSVVVAGDLCWGTCGSGGGGNYIVAVRPGVPELGRKPELAWDLRRSSMVPYVSTAIVDGDYAYLLSDAGFFSCMQHQTGEVVYSERLNDGGSRGANFFSSPVMIDGRVYCLTTNGKLYVVQSGPEYKVLGSYDFNDNCHATPAVHKGRLYVRTAGKLFSIGG
jgi:outer membrane protein assembly factor BamB